MIDIKLLDAYAMSGGNKTADYGDLKGYNNVTVQCVWSGATGTIDGSLILQGSNNNADWDDLMTAKIMSGASGSESLQDWRFGFKHLRLKFTKKQYHRGHAERLAGSKRSVIKMALKRVPDVVPTGS